MAEQDDHHLGLYDKYIVKRIDGSSERGGKHQDCEYFVLDLIHDRHAMAALTAYARSCRKDYPKLAEDLERKVMILTSTFFGGPHAPRR